MVNLYIPKYEDLWFRQMFMADEETMSYNHAWGGVILFPEERWKDWYEDWLTNSDGNRFYRYVINNATNEFLGEVAYHFDKKEKLRLQMLLFMRNIVEMDMV